MKKLSWIIALALLFCFSLSACEEKTPDPNADAKMYAFVHKGVQIVIDAEAAPILASLGAYLDYAESPSCAFEGMDKVYTYSGFEIETYCLSGVDYIASVQLTDDSVTTEKGIAVGSTRDAVLAAYGTPTTENAGALIYSAAGMRLQFLLRDGVVTNIQYLKENV